MHESLQPLTSILIIEDEPSHYELICEYLRLAKLGQKHTDLESCIWARSLAEGTALAQSRQPDIILLDLSLPDSSGIATVQALCADLPEIPVIVLTGHDNLAIATAALQAGALDFLVKGQFDHDVLGRAIRYAQVRHALKARLSLFEKALNSVANGILITDPNAHIEWANPAFSRLTGYALEEVLGHKPNELLKSGKQDRLFYQEMWQTILSGQVWQGEMINRRKDGTLYNESLIIAPVLNADKSIQHFVAVKQDITERKTTEEKIEHLAFYDPLTQLPNRRLLEDHMPRVFAHCQRHGELAVVCLLDLDGFKQVNDSLGHTAGDQLLQEVARRLRDSIRQEDTAARLGGDEFVLLLGGFKKISEYEQTLARIVATIAAPYLLSGQVANISASVGAAIFPSNGNSADQLLRCADLAMYEAKQAGKNRYLLFDFSKTRRQQTNQGAVKKIGQALSNGQFELFYQPKVDCRRGKVEGAEALVRWNHPILGQLTPAEFIPLLEHDDLIIALGDWVLQKTLQQIQAWHEAGIDMKVSVNLSARQLYQKDFLPHLQALLADYSAEIVGLLELEIIETTALEDINTISEIITACRAMGIHVALDDFGTSFSMITRLMKRLTADELKISQGFVVGMLENAGDMAIIRAVISLAASFRRKVNAEGAETVDHILMLMGLGCDVMQGCAIAQPMSAERLSTWLKNFTPDPLWGLFATPRPSRDYFELLLAESNHRDWINQAIANCNALPDESNPASLMEHQQCRFGQWYNSEGLRRFGHLDEFRALDIVHQNIHQTAMRLHKHLQDNNQAEVDADEALLLAQQDEMTQLLRELRTLLADELLGLHTV